jgi:transposase
MTATTVTQAEARAQVCQQLETPGTLILGIDAGKGRHVGCVATAQGSVLQKRLAIRGDAVGWVALELALKRWGALTSYVAAMEPTGGYTVCLDQFFRDRGVTVVYVQPLKVKSNRRTLDLSENKSDERDTVNIVDLVRQKKFYLRMERDEANRLLMAGVKRHTVLTQRRTRLVARLRLLLEEHFPELERCFAEVPCPSLLAILRAGAHPEAIRRQPLSAYQKRFAGLRGLAAGRVAAIYRLAQTSVGCRGMEALFQEQLDAWMQDWTAFETQDQATQRRLATLVQASPAYADLNSIPGVGGMTIAAHLAHIPDPGRFPSASRVVKFFGLDVVERSSGQWNPTQRHISKRGSPIMRKALYNAALACLQHNPVLRAYYDRLIDRGKRPKVALVALMAKLARLLFALHRDHTQWDPDGV